jgi:hypothetical protein
MNASNIIYKNVNASTKHTINSNNIPIKHFQTGIIIIKQHSIYLLIINQLVVYEG